jgi:hypothetical protein
VAGNPISNKSGNVLKGVWDFYFLPPSHPPPKAVMQSAEFLMKEH